MWQEERWGLLAGGIRIFFPLPPSCTGTLWHMFLLLLGRLTMTLGHSRIACNHMENRAVNLGVPIIFQYGLFRHFLLIFLQGCVVIGLREMALN